MKAGRQQIDGETANGYVRTRFDTDYARAARQQEVLLQIVDKLVDPETDVDIPQLLDALHSFDTDLSLADMATFVELARRAQDAEITGQVLNPEDGFILDEGDFGDGRGYILIPDIEKMRRFAAAPPGRLMVHAGGRPRALVESGLPQPPPGGVSGRSSSGVEQRFRKPSVVGSNPTFGSTPRARICAHRQVPLRSPVWFDAQPGARRTAFTAPYAGASVAAGRAAMLGAGPGAFGTREPPNGLGGDLFPWLLFLHVLAGIVAIGPNFAYSTIRTLGRQEPQHANFGTRVSHAISARLVYPFGLVIPATGIAMILVLGIDLTSRAFWWLDIAIVAYAAVYLYSFFVQRPVIERIIEMTSSPPPPGGNWPPPELVALATRAQRGGSAMLAFLVVIVLLMVVKPQF